MNKYFLILMAFSLLNCKTSRQGDAGVTLENTYWKLSEMNGMPVSKLASGKEVHMILTNQGGEKRIKGFAGCNGLGGDYTVDGNKVTFTVITTKMYCEDAMSVENFLTQALQEADTYKIEGETLLLSKDDVQLIKFDAVKQ
jgi:heat shock protein HslJ